MSTVRLEVLQDIWLIKRPFRSQGPLLYSGFGAMDPRRSNHGPEQRSTVDSTGIGIGSTSASHGTSSFPPQCRSSPCFRLLRRTVLRPFQQSAGATMPASDCDSCRAGCGSERNDQVAGTISTGSLRENSRIGRNSGHHLDRPIEVVLCARRRSLRQQLPTGTVGEKGTSKKLDACGGCIQNHEEAAYHLAQFTFSCIHVVL